MRAKILAATLSAGLALGAAEGFHREQESTVVFPWDQPGRGFATRPGARGTNRSGFLEREIPTGRDPTVTRVAVLGDSMTYGTTTAEETWPRAAETALGPPWQVLNFAHYGYDTLACLSTLRHDALRWEPDVVVYAAYTNDLVPNSLIYLGRASYPVWVGAGPSALPLGLRRASALARRVDGALVARRVTDAEDAAAFRDRLRAMRDAAERAGAPLVVFGLLPHVFAGEGCEADDTFCARHRAAHATQAAIAAELGLPFFDSASILSSAPEEAYYPENPDDREHPSPEGHALLGEGFAAAFAAWWAGGEG